MVKVAALDQRAVRRSGWLAVGVGAGLLLGFAVGLARPRIKA